MATIKRTKVDDGCRGGKVAMVKQLKTNFQNVVFFLSPEELEIVKFYLTTNCATLPQFKFPSNKLKFNHGDIRDPYGETRKIDYVFV